MLGNKSNISRIRPEQPPLLEARDLSRTSSTDGKKLLNRLSLLVQAGERVVLRGESGSGKTVLLRALAALDRTDGDLLFGGEQITANSIPAFRAKICYLHQAARLPEGTVREALTEPFAWASHADKTFNEAQALAWLQTLGRGNDFLAKSTNNLSGGEAQITAVTRALLLSPVVLLLDEPTSALDGKTATKLENLLMEWVREGKRALAWATHDEAQALRIASRTIEIAHGSICHG